MKALWLDAEWKPRPEYKLNERERTTKRGYRGNQVYYDPQLYMTDGVGIAMSVEAADVSSKTFPIKDQALAVKGKVIQVGMGGERTPVLLVQFQYQGASIRASVGHSGHDIFPSVIRLMAAKRLDMLPIVTARFPLDEALEAIEQTSKRVDGKVMVKP